MKPHVMFRRLLGTLCGLLGGGIIAGILTILVILVTDSTLGLNTIFPVVICGAVAGAVLSYFFPVIGKAFAEFLKSFLSG